MVVSFHIITKMRGEIFVNTHFSKSKFKYSYPAKILSIGFGNRYRYRLKSGIDIGIGNRFESGIVPSVVETPHAAGFVLLQ